ncbi:4'-phosphopantetheinyl transferase superfamily protein [Streptomyces sp. NPDC047000]|uniref:4'-phosphopantetheinyl transferase family protein n=1 Tax=Streptomyces sp. NPDC047000 TaxID=3155474 RepID=UPI0033DD609F
MIEELLPDPVVTVETFGDDGFGDAPLYPGEEALVSRAVTKRRREFAAVRACARQAMEKLGVAPQPVLNGEGGAPGWPDGLAGSMTHTDGYCAAALVRAHDLASLGIDAEPHSPLPDDVVPFVFLPDEAGRLRGLTERRPEIHWNRILFSAKESVYKAWYPLAGKWLDFTEADIVLDPGPETAPGAAGAPSGRLRATLLVPGPVVDGRAVGVFEGRWQVARGIVTTAVTVPHTSGAAGG